MADWTEILDGALEAPVVTSFTRLGYVLRARAAHFVPIDSYDLSGRTVLVTGATSGLGREIARSSAALGASVILWGRDPSRLASTRDELLRGTPSAAIDIVVADMSEPSAVRAGAAEVLERHPRLDTIVHNAGALTADRRVNSDGVEATVAGQVVGPFLLTSLLLDRLRSSAPARVITMSSGGMYTTGLDVAHLEMGADYRGAEQYARAKRAQVTLNEMWAERSAGFGVVFQALHPGWADTPGLREALPSFRRVIGPLLRSTVEGADTAMWLLADDGEPMRANGGFWHDRHRRSIHKIARTRRSDTPAERERLWQWCVERAGVDPFSRCS